MRLSNQGQFREQVRFLKRQFLQDESLPFGDILTDDIVSQAMTALDGVWRDRIYTPLVTLWVFLSQVLSADIRVARLWHDYLLIAYRKARAPVSQKRVLIAKPEVDCRKSSSRL